MIRTDFSALDDELQEAESIRYAATMVCLIRLKNGRMAVLGQMRTLHAIVDTLEEAFTVAESIKSTWRPEVKKSAPAPKLNLNLELDL